MHRPQRKKTGTRTQRLNEMSKPIYVKSIDDSVKNAKRENIRKEKEKRGYVFAKTDSKGKSTEASEETL